ncbi:hypothetical protein V6C53_12690 [Desulfocurvibacter africanus]|uniref:hypothetical protein n=1 Tax=Desulfocurvibacter africanus TaxID=873 RepID=UPI0002FFC290|nr:hypothetical protein [Desulfocurvibacter africanus]
MDKRRNPWLERKSRQNFETLEIIQRRFCCWRRKLLEIAGNDSQSDSMERLPRGGCLGAESG